MNTRFRTTAITVIGASFTLCFAESTGVAAMQQEPSAKTSSAVRVAQQNLEAVQARYAAGVVTNEEVEQAKSALAIVQAKAQLQDSQAQLERQRRMLRAGAISVDDLEVSQLTVTASEVALKQVRLEQRRQVANRQQALVQVGAVSKQEAATVNTALAAAQTELAEAQARHKIQNIDLFKSRLRKQQQLYRAGVASQADVQRAEAEYEAAKKAIQPFLVPR